MKRSLLLIAGWLALLLGAIAALVYGFALIDPAGAQAANDADPFGTPPSTRAMLFALGLALAIKLVGVALIVLAHREPAKAPA